LLYRAVVPADVGDRALAIAVLSAIVLIETGMLLGNHRDRHYAARFKPAKGDDGFSLAFDSQTGRLCRMYEYIEPPPDASKLEEQATSAERRNADWIRAQPACKDLR
jgi:hypothetical protein